MAKQKKDPNFPMQGRGGAMGGKYARKAENLTKKELKAAGAAKAARKRTVSISDTKRVDGKGITVGPGGKPLTGSVRLQNGAMAVYKDGKRVVKAKAATVSRPSTGSSATARKVSDDQTGGGRTAAQKAAARRRADNAGVAAGTIRQGAAGRGARKYNAKTGRWEKVNQAGLGGTAKIGAVKKSSPKPTGSTPSKPGTTTNPITGATSSSPFSGTRPATTGNKVADAATAAQKAAKARRAEAARYSGQGKRKPKVTGWSSN